jgi:5,10-methylenetetrahydromethanopterin reductase
MTGVNGERQPHRQVGFAVRDPWPWTDLTELVRRAEDGGYRALFLPEIAGRDAFATLTGLAGERGTLLLGTGIVPMNARRPMLTAMGAATVHERSGGRAILGLGTGPLVGGALDRLEELVGVMRRLFAGDVAELDGERLRLSLPLATPPPIWISALGPRSVRLAGRIADGVLLNWCTPERVADAAAAVREAAEAAGRDPSSVTVGAYVRARLGDDPDAGILAVQAAASEYASYPAYARQFELMGLGAEARTAAAARRSSRPQDVPEALIRAVALVGEDAVARDRLQAYLDAGADVPVVYPVVAPGEAVAVATRTLASLMPSR